MEWRKIRAYMQCAPRGHTRVHGPLRSGKTWTLPRPESPLRAWAIPVSDLGDTIYPGLTLACVGRPPWPKRGRGSDRTHPRVRGPSASGVDDLEAALDSPSRAWAVYVHEMGQARLNGLTLACVGRPPTRP